MSNGSQQATKASPKHTHNDRRLSECQNKQVLRRPIFSIGQFLFEIILKYEEIFKSMEHQVKPDFCKLVLP